MPQHTDALSQQGSVTEQSIKASNLLRALDLSTSTTMGSVKSSEAPPPINVLDQRASTESQKDGMDSHTHSPGTDVLGKEGAASGSGVDQKPKDATKGVEDDGLDKANDDLISSYWKLQYDSDFVLNYEQRKSKASSFFETFSL